MLYQWVPKTASRAVFLTLLLSVAAVTSGAADFPTLSQYDPQWPLDGRTAFQLVVPPSGNLEIGTVWWTGRFYKGGTGPIESFKLRVYEDAIRTPGGLIWETRIVDFLTERISGNDFFYSAEIPRVVLPTGPVAWVEIQAVAPALPQWGILAIHSPETRRLTRLLRAPELGVFRWTSFPWFTGDGELSGCEAFVDPQGQDPGDSTGSGRFPNVDFTEPIVRPNPTSGFVRISFTLPALVHLEAGVFDVRGRRVRNLVDEMRPDGPILLFWNGRSDDGGAVSSGIYLLRVDVNSRKYFRRKILMLREKADG